MGNTYDNAFAESFVKTLKKEDICLWEHESFTDPVERVPQFIQSGGTKESATCHRWSLRLYCRMKTENENSDRSR
jgi:hypothetical protein